MMNNKVDNDTPDAVKNIDEAKERLKKLNKGKVKQNTKQAQFNRGY